MKTQHNTINVHWNTLKYLQSQRNAIQTHQNPNELHQCRRSSASGYTSKPSGLNSEQHEIPAALRSPPMIPVSRNTWCKPAHDMVQVLRLLVLVAQYIKRLLPHGAPHEKSITRSSWDCSRWAWTPPPSACHPHPSGSGTTGTGPNSHRRSSWPACAGRALRTSNNRKMRPAWHCDQIELRKWGEVCCAPIDVVSAAKLGLCLRSYLIGSTPWPLNVTAPN